MPVRWSDVTVRHTGYTDAALRGRKLDRDAKILAEELEDRPSDPFVLFNLGSIAIERQDWRAALSYLSRSLAGSAPTDSITHKLYALIARSHQALGETEAALAACGKGLSLCPDDAELLFREAVIRRNKGDATGAEACWRRILTLRRPERFSSVDQGIYGHLTRRNLAMLAQERGDTATAVRLWSEVLAECPGDREIWTHAPGSVRAQNERGTRQAPNLQRPKAPARFALITASPAPPMIPVPHAAPTPPVRVLPRLYRSLKRRINGDP